MDDRFSVSCCLACCVREYLVVVAVRTGSVCVAGRLFRSAGPSPTHQAAGVAQPFEGYTSVPKRKNAVDRRVAETETARPVAGTESRSPASLVTEDTPELAATGILSPEENGTPAEASANGKSAPAAAATRIPETERLVPAAAGAEVVTDTAAERRSAVVVIASLAESCRGRRCFVHGGTDGTAWWRFFVLGFLWVMTRVGWCHAMDRWEVGDLHARGTMWIWSSAIAAGQGGDMVVVIGTKTREKTLVSH